MGEDDDQPEQLDADAITAAVGPIDDDKRVQLALEDGRTVVARVRTVQDGDHDCPAEDCLQQLDSKRALKTHIGRAHPELTARTCPSCGEDFNAPPSRDQRYCSTDCRHAARKQEKVCPACERPFLTGREGTERERNLCSIWCAYETRRDEDRPDGYPAARRELEDEGHDGEALLGRLQAALGPEWARTSVHVRYLVEETDLDYRDAAAQVADEADRDRDSDTVARQYVEDIVDAQERLPQRLAADAVLEVLEAESTVLAIAEQLRLTSERTKNLLTWLGLRGEVATIDARGGTLSGLGEG